ncbi:O-antigen ligase family protein [Ideonella sp.]|uniref:O-antigen ligase family protein n=1 Tax=Ideonella sp. TaxID=1929293 RepID=UPI002E2EF5FF|nr:O-antigen ligase family protein [Ideonella sp.]
MAAASLMLLRLLDGHASMRLSMRVRWLVGAVAVSMMVSTLASPRVFIAWDRLELYYALALLGLSIYLLHRDDDAPGAAPYWLAIALVHAAVLVEVVFWLLQLQGNGANASPRMPYHANIRHFGYLGYLAAAAAIAVALRWRRLGLTGLVLGTAALYGIVQLGSRGALLGWLIFLAAGCGLAPKDQRGRLLAFGAASTLLAFGMSWVLGELGLIGGGSLIDRAQHGEVAAASGRLPLWTDVLKAIALHPWWGYGPDGHSFLNCCGSYGPYIARTSQAHNVLLQLLEEFGLIGTLLIGMLVNHLARSQARPRGWFALARADDETRWLVAMLIGLLAFGLVDGPFYYPVPLLIFAVLSGLLMASARRTVRFVP